MEDLISFRLQGDFAAFRDPSITTSQSVYYIPSKSNIIGLLAGIIGIERSHSLSQNIFSSGIIPFFKDTKVGIRVNNESEKVAIFSNHRSLKETKTKPFKIELLQSPDYSVFVSTSEE